MFLDPFLTYFSDVTALKNLLVDIIITNWTKNLQPTFQKGRFMIELLEL